MIPRRPLQPVVLVWSQPELVQGSSTVRADCCPSPQRRGGCQAVLFSGKGGALASWACCSCGCHGQAEWGADISPTCNSPVGTPCSPFAGERWLPGIQAWTNPAVQTQEFRSSCCPKEHPTLPVTWLTEADGPLSRRSECSAVATALSSCLTCLPWCLRGSLCRNEQCGGGCLPVRSDSGVLALHCSGCSIPASVGELSVGLILQMFGTAQEGNGNTGQCKEGGLLPPFLLSRTTKQHSPLWQIWGFIKPGLTDNHCHHFLGRTRVQHPVSNNYCEDMLRSWASASNMSSTDSTSTGSTPWSS